MTVGELKQRLEFIDDDAEVRIAYQESWPLQATVRGLTEGDELQADPDMDDEERDEVEAKLADVVWLVEGMQCDDSPYAPHGVFDAACR